MIGKLTGLLDSVHDDHVIVDVGGVGYIVHCPLRIAAMMTIGDKISLFIDTQTKETGVSLYGFNAMSDKQCFLTLITIKGLGPKMALAILGKLSAEQVYNAITSKDHNAFLAISGIGNKIVTRVFSELKPEDLYCDNFDVSHSNKYNQDSKIRDDAISALTNLGLNRSEAHAVVSKILHNNEKIDLSSLIRLALKQVNS